MSEYRIAKYIAHCGYASRREAEKLIEKKLVFVNGSLVLDYAFKVNSHFDNIFVDGKKLLLIEKPRLWIYHKPKGVITTHKDPQKRRTVFETLPKTMPRVISIGRLDYNTEGLLLLTNSPLLARNMEYPSFGVIRTYRCRIFGKLRESDIEQLKSGLCINGVEYKSIDVTVDNEFSSSNSWIVLSLREGKNREIRKVLEFLGFQVTRLIRVSYGKFRLDKLKKGEILEIDSKLFCEYLIKEEKNVRL